MEERIISSEEYRKALEIINLYEKQNPDSSMEPDFTKRLKIIETITDSEEKINELNYLCQDIANQFTYQMSFIENAIQEALDEAPEEVLNENGWHTIEDITQNINVTSSYEW